MTSAGHAGNRREQSPWRQRIKSLIGLPTYREGPLLDLRAIIKNAGWLSLVQLFNYTLPLLTIPIVARAFEPHTFGILSALNAFGLYVGVAANYGLCVSGPRSIARLRADLPLLSKTVSGFLTAQFFTGAAAILIFLVALPLFPPVRGYKLVGFLVLTQMFATAAAPQWVYVGLQHTRSFALNQFVFRGLAVVLIVFLIRAPDDLLLYVSLNCCAAVAILISSIMGLARYQVRWVAPEFPEIILIIRQSTQLFLSRISFNVYIGATVPIVAMVLGPGAAGIFALADRVRFVAGTMIDPITDAAYPFLCRMAGREETSVEAWTKRIVFRGIVVVSALISIGLFTFAPYIIWILGGDKFEDAILVLRMIAFVPLLTSLWKSFGNQIMLPLRMDREYTWIVTLGALCSVSGTFVLTKEFGLAGAALNLLVVEICMAAAFALTVNRRIGVLTLFFDH
jgi:PST family polysaccharide transporter